MQQSKEEFFNTILNYYTDLSQNAISEELLKGLATRITDYYYKQYERFKLQYPKSIKRYSAFQIEDFNHPYTFEMVIEYFKDKLGTDYVKPSCILLKFTEHELITFEKSREDFHNMF